MWEDIFEVIEDLNVKPLFLGKHREILDEYLVNMLTWCRNLQIDPEIPLWAAAARVIDSLKIRYSETNFLQLCTKAKRSRERNL